MILKTFDQDTIDLIPEQIKMASPLALSQYEITTWQLVYYNPGMNVKIIRQHNDTITQVKLLQIIQRRALRWKLPFSENYKMS